MPISHSFIPKTSNCVVIMQRVPNISNAIAEPKQYTAYSSGIPELITFGTSFSKFMICPIAASPNTEQNSKLETSFANILMQFSSLVAMLRVVLTSLGHTKNFKY